MTSPLGRRLVAATAGLAAVLSTVAVAAPASAEVLSKSDPAGDVSDVAGQESDKTHGDTVDVRLEHARRLVRVRLDYLALDRVGALIQQSIRIETPTQNFYATARAQPGNWGGDLLFSGGACNGAETRFDYGADRFALSVPRGCLGNPRWVRVGVGTSTYADDQDFGTFDDALQRQQDLYYTGPKLSPRLSRAGGSYTG